MENRWNIVDYDGDLYRLFIHSITDDFILYSPNETSNVRLRLNFHNKLGININLIVPCE